MEFVTPLITEFTDSDIPEEYLDWDETTVYILEPSTLTNSSVVRYGNYYYRSLVNNNVGFRPDLYLNTKWMVLKISNRLAMLDLQSQTLTKVNSASFYVEFDRPYLANTIGIGYLNCSKITIEHLDALGNPISSATQIIEYSVNDDVEDYFTYIYAEYSFIKNTTQLFRIVESGVKIRITFESTTNYISVGYLVVGEAISMGTSQYGVKFGHNSYAKKEFDEYGRLTLVKRAVQSTLDFETDVVRNKTMYVLSKTRDIYNDIVMFIVDESENSAYQNLITLGMIQNADLVITYPTFSTMSWSIIEAI